MAKIPVPIALAAQRLALARMYIDLSLAFRATIHNNKPAEPDANLTLVAVAVMKGHASGHPMTASGIAARLHMPRISTRTRLQKLVESGLIVRIGDRYYLEPKRAKRVPHRDKFELILTQAIEVLGPYLSNLDV